MALREVFARLFPPSCCKQPPWTLGTFPQIGKHPKLARHRTHWADHIVYYFWWIRRQRSISPEQQEDFNCKHVIVFPSVATWPRNTLEASDIRELRLLLLAISLRAKNNSGDPQSTLKHGRLTDSEVQESFITNAADKHLELVLSTKQLRYYIRGWVEQEQISCWNLYFYTVLGLFI